MNHSKSSNSSPTITSWVAEHVMGWKCYRPDDWCQCDVDAVCDDGFDAVINHDTVLRPSAEVGRPTIWNPLTDANDDLEVLRKVRESASDSERVRFAYVLSDIWLERDVTAIDGCWWLAHEIGDYTRAAAKAKGWTEQ